MDCHGGDDFAWRNRGARRRGGSGLDCREVGGAIGDCCRQSSAHHRLAIVRRFQLSAQRLGGVVRSVAGPRQPVSAFVDERPRFGSLQVMVCHPGRQHSHQLAMALADAGMLARYITGLPTHTSVGGRVAAPILRRWASAYEIPIDPRRVRHLFVASALRQASRRLLTASRSCDAGHRADGLFDLIVSRSIAKERPAAVVCYENMH